MVGFSAALGLHWQNQGAGGAVMELEPIKTSPSTRIVTFWLYIWP